LGRRIAVSMLDPSLYERVFDETHVGLHARMLSYIS